MSTAVDFGDLGLTARQDGEVRAVLGQWERERQRLCRARMGLAAKAGGERRVLRGADGNGGSVTMMVDGYSYHYWGQRLGYGCWADAGWCREYLRDNPAARVRSRGRTQAVVAGLAAADRPRSERRFVKRYGTGMKRET